MVVLQLLIATSLFFVWVVRYENIVTEFRDYALPDWLRDLVGILKLTCAALLVVGIWREGLALFGSVGLVGLMSCAVAIHFRRGTPLGARLPAFSLLALSLFIAVMNGGLLSA